MEYWADTCNSQLEWADMEASPTHLKVISYFRILLSSKGNILLFIQ